MPAEPSFSDIQKAHRRIKNFIHYTPVHTSTALNKITGSEIYFKCENFQKAGAFKFRGATNAVQSLDKKDASRGVATHSSGNHAAALALAASQRGLPSHIVMPSSAPEIKIEAVKYYGGKITFCEPTLESRETTLKKLIEMNGAVIIHPFDNTDVIAGQGTAAIEFLEKKPDLDIIMTPVGGGGLFSGTLISSKTLRPDIKAYGAEPKNADDAYRSFKNRILYSPLKPNTIADGLLTGLSELTFKIITDKADDIFIVTEESIVIAMKLVWERMKIIIEPSSAVPLAVVLENRDVFRGKKTGIILSGGNVDLNHLPF